MSAKMPKCNQAKQNKKVNMKRQGVSAEKRGLKQVQTSVRQKSRPQQK